MPRINARMGPARTPRSMSGTIDVVDVPTRFVSRRGSTRRTFAPTNRPATNVHHAATLEWRDEHRSACSTR
jgi:hypothetical protein